MTPPGSQKETLSLADPRKADEASVIGATAAGAEEFDIGDDGVDQ